MINAKISNESEIKSVNEYFNKHYKEICTQKKQPLKAVAEKHIDAPELEITLNGKEKLAFSYSSSDSVMYQQLAITEWDQEFIVALDGKYDVSVEGADKLLDGVENLYCADKGLFMYHFNTHEWGSYVLRIDSFKSNTVNVVIFPFNEAS